MATKQIKKTPAKKTSAKAAKAAKATVTKPQGSILETISTNIDNVQSFAKQAYFAGLGAYGRSFEEIKARYVKANQGIQAGYAKINEEGQSLVKDLVDRGEKVQDDAEGLLKEGRATVEQKIEIARKRLGGLVSVVDIPARLQDMSDKLESLSKDLKKTA